MADKSAAKWLVERAKQSLLKKDPFEAKTWLITAKTLYPADFSVQYEAYVIEQNARKVAESAKMFFEMFEKFPDKSLIWEEVLHITEALEGCDVDSSDGEFLKEMFSCLPQTAQREILLKAAGQCRDCIEKCRTMLLLMRHFPDVIPKNGVALTEMLIDAEDSEYKNTAINPYRKLLVCDVLPHLLASESLTIIESPESQFSEEILPGITQGQVYKWLELAIEFYTSCTTSQTNTQDPQLLSPDTGQTVVNQTRDIIEGVHDGKGPWARLYDLFCLTANKCGWSQVTRILDKLDMLAHRNSKARWACLSELHHKLKKAAKQIPVEGCQTEPPEKGGVFYATLVLFLQTVWEYCKAVNKMDSTTSVAGSRYPLVLLEDIDRQTTSPEDSPIPKKKKKKLTVSGPGSPSKDDKNKHSPAIFIAKSCGVVSPSIADDFVVSVDAWHLLNTHSNYKNKFTRLLNKWQVSDWTWMDSFKVDRLVYKNKYKKVIEFLKEQKELLEIDPSENPGVLIRATLQLSCCSFCLGEHKRACTEALDALQVFSSHPSPTQASDVRSPLKRSTSVISTSHSAAKELDKPDKPAAASPGLTGRCFCLMQCTEAEVLSFCIHLLITSLKKILATEARNDTMLGHMIVMLQYDWPKEEHTFLELTERIRNQGSFKYYCFLDYVVVIDILEEFAFLYNEGNVNLDLMQSTPVGPRSRTVTRGVNKGAKEDFRAAMERQVARSDESIEALIRTFFMEERDTLLP